MCRKQTSAALERSQRGEGKGGGRKGGEGRGAGGREWMGHSKVQIEGLSARRKK